MRVHKNRQSPEHQINWNLRVLIIDNDKGNETCTWSLLVSWNINQTIRANPRRTISLNKKRISVKDKCFLDTHEIAASPT